MVWQRLTSWIVRHIVFWEGFAFDVTADGRFVRPGNIMGYVYV